MVTSVSARGHWASSSLSLTLWTALAHPDEAVRLEVHGTLTAWIKDGDPTWSEQQIRKALRGMAGTDVAPFVIGELGIEAAVLVARVLFSRRFGGTRLRIASEDSLADDYGVVVTDQLRYYVQGRRLGALPGSSAGAAAVLVPAARTRAAEHVNLARASRALPAAALVTDRGPVIRVTTTLWSGLAGTALARATQASGVLGGKSLSELGLAIAADSAGITVSARSPEATIRLSALQAGQRLLMLDVGAAEADAVEAPTIAVRLEPLAAGSDSAPLKAITAWRLPQLNAWLRFYKTSARDLPGELRRLILTEVAMHRGLLDADLMETLA